MKKILLAFVVTLMFSGCSWFTYQNGQLVGKKTGINYTLAYKVAATGVNILKSLYLSPVINDKISASTKSSLEHAYKYAKTTDQFVKEAKGILKKEVGAISVTEKENTLYISTATGDI